MIIVRLWGGLGNQLFQYSFGQYLEIETDKKVFYDVASFGTDRKSTRLNSSHNVISRMPSSA